jgi:hypothetical protein
LLSLFLSKHFIAVVLIDDSDPIFAQKKGGGKGKRNKRKYIQCCGPNGKIMQLHTC